MLKTKTRPKTIILSYKRHKIKTKFLTIFSEQHKQEVLENDKVIIVMKKRRH